MEEIIRQYLEEISGVSPSNREELEAFRVHWLGKKGIVTGLFSEMKDLPADRKRQAGQMVNTLKQAVLLKLEQHSELKKQDPRKADRDTDLTLPANFLELGAGHPVSIVGREMNGIFSRMGFTIQEGPEIEDDWHNFTALNFAADHPARDMQDTFFIEKSPDILLRTHTSSVQIRVMEGQKPPIRNIFPGRVFRNEAISARAHCIFHQIEGLYIDEDISFADLKQTLYYFASELFGEGIGIRFRPSYFPFTEPSAEMDISCLICSGKGCRVCKYSGWVEILGCGMVDPNVLENCGIDSEKYSGFAFGIGIERTAMLKYQIDDIRLFFENDVRFIRQFRSMHG
ncbi:MAG: phenylalanine--tRNA ligase subunit alpha [Bacteroidales bacterium]|nr:phenylalanine--tRNA ligase subunit alpha [Bacteroidales bacterium]